MTAPANFKCCCSPGGECPTDCIFGNTIDEGCCHKADVLLFWSERPGHTITQHYRVGSLFPGQPGCETCYTVTCPQMGPVQSIYKYNQCRFRFVYPGPGGAVTLTQLPFSGDPLAIGWEACANPVCEPSYCPDDCCGTQLQPPGGCKCKTWYGAGQGGLNQWRYDTMMDEPANLWFPEMECHKDGDPLNAAIPVGRLGSDFIALVYLERWWKIAEDCPPNARIYVPGCTQSTEGGNCGGIPFVTSDLVPKWWIYACAGIPLYQFELDEALELGVIDGSEYDAIMAKVALKQQPPQPPLMKMARAGYLVARDWRPDQRQAFLDLDAMFPGAGYAPCDQPVAQMAELGPFRKRYTAQFADQVARPLLHKADVVTELDPYQATCMIDYPGSWSNFKDYDYWRQRQWVYFRGVPGGWTWVNWNAAAGTGLTEEEAIAEGYGRGTGVGDPNTLLSAPLLSMRGEPRGPCACTDCGPVEPACPNTTYCSMCSGGVIDPGACSACGGPIAACDPPIKCLKFSITPECEGVRFQFSSYVFENDLNYDPETNTCVMTGEYRCHYQVNSYLVEAKRSVDSWSDSIPFTCRTESPPLPVFNAWKPVGRAHLGQEDICADIVAAPVPVYTVQDLCCGGYCNASTDVFYDWPSSPAGCPTVGPGNPNQFPCPSPGPVKVCTPSYACPPHSTPAQIACIGFTPVCDPTP